MQRFVVLRPCCPHWYYLAQSEESITISCLDDGIFPKGEEEGEKPLAIPANQYAVAVFGESREIFDRQGRDEAVKNRQLDLFAR